MMLGLAGAAQAGGDTVPAVMRRSAAEEPLAAPEPATRRCAARADSASRRARPRCCRCCCKGMPNKLIARELNLSVETVKDHVAAVLRALGVSSRTQAVLAVSQMSQAQPRPGGVAHHLATLSLRRAATAAPHAR